MSKLLHRTFIAGIVLLLGGRVLSPMSGSAQNAPLYTTLHYLTNGVPPIDGTQPVNLFWGSDHALFGVTYNGGEEAGGAIFTINPDGSGEAPLVSFLPSVTGNSNSVLPVISVVDNYFSGPLLSGLSATPGADGMLYGTTFYGGVNNDGTVFAISQNGTGQTTLHSFGAADAHPLNVIQGYDGALYGTTFSGGTNNQGVIFRLASDGSSYSILYNFSGTDGYNCSSLFQGSDGMLYGTLLIGTNGTGAGGTVFRINTNGDDYTVLTNLPVNISNPSSMIQASDGYLYLTPFGTGQGIYQMNTNGSGLTALHLFSGASDGSRPVGLVQGPNGVIYGTTIAGGTNLDITSSGGTLYQINLGGGGYNIIYNFNNANENSYSPIGAPAPGPSSGNGGVLYGTTSNTKGSVFSLTINPPTNITATATSASGGTVVFGPAWAFNYTLQSNTNVASTNWVNVTNGTPIVGMQVTNSGPATFYRLVYP